MTENKGLLSVKMDLVFKLIFGDQRNTDILASFLKSVLDIPEEEYDLITVVDVLTNNNTPRPRDGTVELDAIHGNE